MKRRLQFVLLWLMAACLCPALYSQDEPSASQQTEPAQAPQRRVLPRAPEASGYEILTKVKRTANNLGFYPDRILAIIRRQWYPKIPRDVKGGEPSTTEIEFTILRDGSLGNMNLSQSSGNNMLDNAAREAVQSTSPFPPLPSRWPDKSLTFRFHFLYNQEPSLEAPACNGPGRGGTFRVGNGVTAPRTLNQSDPAYAEEARRIKFQGVVVLTGTVEPDGDFDNLCVEQPLGYGLDEKAMAAVKTWKFEPATKDGQTVPVRISVEVSFHLY